MAKVSCILRHRGVQLILAFSWVRLAFLVAGKGRGECFYFFCFFHFIPVPLSSLSLSFISSTISSISFLPFSGRRHKMTHKGWRVVKPRHNQLNLICAGPSCSKLTTSLVNDLLKFTSSDTQIYWNFLLKNVSSFALQKLLTFFQQKN